MDWIIDYYETAMGKCPVREFIDTLTDDSQAKYILITGLLKQYGTLVKEPSIRHITSHRKLYEIRIKEKDGISRILYFAHTGKRFVLLHGFTKKTDKTPANEIEIAEQRMKDHILRGVHHEEK